MHFAPSSTPPNTYFKELDSNFMLVGMAVRQGLQFCIMLPFMLQDFTQGSENSCSMLLQIFTAPHLLGCLHVLELVKAGQGLRVALKHPDNWIAEGQ